LKVGTEFGISGDVVLENGFVKNISYIYSLNFRIAREVFGASKNVLSYVLDFENNSVFNSLIIGRPGSGKTTIIRDLCKVISDGISNFHGINVRCC